MNDLENATETINRAIAMDLWSLTDHTKVTRQEFLDAIARIEQQAQEREGETFRNPCEHGCPKDEPCPTDCDCTCHTDEPVRYRALRNLLEMKHDRMTRLEGEIARLRAALELAIMTVECASIDIRTGEELPWYRAAKSALTAEAKPEAAAKEIYSDSNRSADLWALGVRPESPAPVTECAARALLSDFVRHAAPLAAHAGSEWSSVTTIPIDDGELGLSQSCHWLNETSKEAIELFATPCECAGLREDVESARNLQEITEQSMVAQAQSFQERENKLRAELATANERAEANWTSLERVKAKLSDNHNECKGLRQQIADDAVTLEYRSRVIETQTKRAAEYERDLAAAQAGWKEAVEGLRNIQRTPALPFPDPMAHSWRVYAEALYRAYCDIQRRAAAIVARFDAQGGKDA